MCARGIIVEYLPTWIMQKANVTDIKTWVLYNYVYPTDLYYFLGNISSVQMSAISFASLG